MTADKPKHVLSLLNPRNMADRLSGARSDFFLPFQFACNSRTNDKWEILLMPIADVNKHSISRAVYDVASKKFSAPQSVPLWKSLLDRSSKLRSTMRLDNMVASQAAGVNLPPHVRETTISMRSAESVTGAPSFELEASILGAHRFSESQLANVPGFALTVDAMMSMFFYNTAEASVPGQFWDTDTDISKLIENDAPVPHGIMPIPGSKAGWAHYTPWIMVFGNEKFLTTPLSNSELPAFIGKTKSGQSGCTPLDAVSQWLSRSDAFLVGEKLDLIRRTQGYDRDQANQHASASA